MRSLFPLGITEKLIPEQKQLVLDGGCQASSAIASELNFSIYELIENLARK